MKHRIWPFVAGALLFGVILSFALNTSSKYQDAVIPTVVVISPTTTSELPPGVHPTNTIPTQQNNDVYYLYILDRDGDPVQEFTCLGPHLTYGSNGSIDCRRPDGKYITIAATVPIIKLPEHIPLKDQQ